MRILFVTHRFPGQELRGDQLRAWQQLRALAPRHSITLLSLAQTPPRPELLRELQSICERVVSIAHSTPAMLLRAALAAFSRRPLQVALYDVPALQQSLDVLLKHSTFDLVHLQLARLGGLLPLVGSVPCVIDLVDALSLNMARRAALDRGPLGWVAKLEARRLRRFEQTLCTRASATTICSTTDQLALGAPPNLRVVGNGVDLARFPFATGPRDPDCIVFVGNLGYFPNIDAVQWFVTQVWPQLQARRPMLRLQLVGARPAPVLRSLATAEARIELIGEVPEVHSWLSRAALAIAPLRAGSGQQLKVLEAFAAGTPVVSTAVSAAGLEAVDGRHLLIADQPADFAAAILRLLDDSALALKLARQARDLVESRYSWAASAQALEQVWVTAVESQYKAGGLTS